MKDLTGITKPNNTCACAGNPFTDKYNKPIDCPKTVRLKPKESYMDTVIKWFLYGII